MPQHATPPAVPCLIFSDMRKFFFSSFIRRMRTYEAQAQDTTSVLPPCHQRRENAIYRCTSVPPYMETSNTKAEAVERPRERVTNSNGQQFVPRWESLNVVLFPRGGLLNVVQRPCERVAHRNGQKCVPHWESHQCGTKYVPDCALYPGERSIHETHTRAPRITVSQQSATDAVVPQQ